jgi:hypothetical protein
MPDPTPPPAARAEAEALLLELAKEGRIVLTVSERDRGIAADRIAAFAARVAAEARGAALAEAAGAARRVQAAARKWDTGGSLSDPVTAYGAGGESAAKMISEDLRALAAQPPAPRAGRAPTESEAEHGE